MFSKPLLATTVAAILFTPTAFAQDSNDNTIIVTASRVAETVDQTLASVSVINREQIEHSQANSVEELLRNQAGITFVNNGGLGKSTSIFIRGTDNSHLLLMIDGVRISSATLGEASSQFISLSQVERIEIVRGTKSSLYGSDAIGGIIQIFTRRGHKGHHLSASASQGSYNTRDISLSFSGAENGFHYSAAVSRLSSDGFDARQPALIWGTLLDQPDDDGFINDSFSMQFGKNFTKGTSLTAYLQQSSGITEYDGSIDNETIFKQASRGIKTKLQPNEYWDLSLHIGSSLDEKEYRLDGTYRSTFNTKRDIATWQNDHIIGDETLMTFGIDYYKDRVESNEDYKETKRSNNGIFTQLQTELSIVHLSVGLREDNDSSFGKHHSGHINLGLDFTPSTRLIGGYGTAFKAPSFNDLYWPDNGWSSGNPNVQPETSKNSELGVISQQSWGTLDIRAFRNHISDLIDWSPDQSGKWLPSNIDSAMIKGLELQYTATLASINISTNLNFLEPVNKKSNQLLPRRSKRHAAINLDKHLGNTLIGITATAYSKRYDDVENTQKLGGYGLIDLRAEYAVTPSFSIKGKISNALDKEYQTAYTYNTAGRALYISVAYNK